MSIPAILNYTGEVEGNPFPVRNNCSFRLNRECKVMLLFSLVVWAGLATTCVSVPSLSPSIKWVIISCAFFGIVFAVVLKVLCGSTAAIEEEGIELENFTGLDHEDQDSTEERVSNEMRSSTQDETSNQETNEV